MRRTDTALLGIAATCSGTRLSGLPSYSGSAAAHREVQDPVQQIARRVMKERGVAINDLYGFAEPRLEGIRRPENVHFTDQGLRLLPEQIAEHIHPEIRQETLSR